MSRLILEGNLQKNFGEYYPVPYIDRVYIDDQGDQMITVEIHYSFLFNMPPEIQDKKLEENMAIISETLSSYHFYMLLARTPSYIGEQAGVINKIKQDDNPDILDYKSFGLPIAKLNTLSNPFDVVEMLTYDSSLLFDVLKSIDKDSDSIIVDIDEKQLREKMLKKEYSNFTTDGETRVVKVSGIVKEKVHDMLYPFSGYKSAGAAGDLSLLAFSSIEPISQLFNPKNRNRMTTSRANALYFSDIAYERLLISDGNFQSPTFTVPNQVQTKFFDINNELYNDVPMQSINGTHHKSVPDLRPEIIQKFNAVLDSYQPEALAENAASPRPGPLMESINSIKFAMATSNSITILPEIQKARRIMPERSTGTFTGQLYEDLGTLLTRANAVIERQPQVAKNLIANSKIIDRRQKENLYDLPDPKVVAQQMSKGSDLLKNFFLDRKIVTTNQPSSRVSFADYDVAADTRFESYIDGLGADEFTSYDDDDLLLMMLPNGKVWSLDDPEYQGLLNDNYFAMEEYNVTFGYFLFDYDTAIRKNSYVANIFDVDRIIDFFGMPFVQAYYQPLQVRLHKYDPSPKLNQTHKHPIMTFVTPLSWTDPKRTGTNEYHPGGAHPNAHGEIYRHGTTYENGAPHQEFPEKIEIAQKNPPETFSKPSDRLRGTTLFSAGNKLSSGGGGKGIGLFGKGSGPGNIGRASAALNRNDKSKKSSTPSIVINSYLAQRSLHVVNENLLNDKVGVDLSYIYGEDINANYINNRYRLMAFEFQNIDQQATLDKYEDKVYDKYDVEIDIADGTRQCVLAIIQNFYDNMMIFKEEYVDLARQFCSYNNIDNRFNDFFQTAINQRYADDPTRAPWVYSVCMYVRHMEFLTDRFNGNTSDQLLEARDLLQRISPDTGDLDQVEAFWNILQETFDDFYGPNSKIGRYLQKTSSELDGNGKNGIFNPVIYQRNYRATHESYVRSSFVVDDRNEFLSLINDERTRYRDAEQEYNDAIFRASLPPMEKEIDPAFEGGCPTTAFQCGNPFMQMALPGAKKCSGKIVKDGICVCPALTAEDENGKCQPTHTLEKEQSFGSTGTTYNNDLIVIDVGGSDKPSATEQKAAKSSANDSAASSSDSISDDQASYEAGYIKKNKEYHNKNKLDCRYVRYMNPAGSDPAGYYWVYTNGNKYEKYNKSRYGTPSDRAMRRRKKDCCCGKLFKKNSKKCRCYSMMSNGTWQLESTSTSALKSVIKASGRYKG